jgi:hypothetical protein
MLAFSRLPPLVNGVTPVESHLLLFIGPHKKKRHYTSIKKKCQIECRKAYNNYVSTMISDDIKSNPNRLWSFIKSKRCDSTGVTPFTKGGSLEKANIQGY